MAEAAREEPAVAASERAVGGGERDGSGSDDDGERGGREMRGGGEEREREDRKGVVMVRGKGMWEWGSERAYTRAGYFRA